MRFEMLGPLRVLVDGGEVALRAGRERVLLAMLLLHTDRAVPVDQLVEELWPDQQPRGARNQLQACVSRLRKRFAEAGAPGELITTEVAGYRLRVDPERVDAHEFRSLVADARTAARPEEARDRYRAAAALWRGPALAGVDSPEVRRAAAALGEERVQSLQECIGVELGLGRASELVGELTELVQRYPYREGLHAALMRALYGAGRPADALAAYRRARQLLRDELGSDPGEELQRLHHAILNRDSELDAPRPVATITRPVVPRELPAEPTCFVGREQEAARVREALLPVDRSDRHRPPVVVLYGPGGVGKSALAIRVAHEVAAEFPDGQLYVDLCGSTPGMRPLTAVEVLGRFLRRLGVAPDQIPSDEAEASALFRSVTADRRLLLLLDNVASKDHVAALLPGAPGCGVLVTSRHPLPSLDVDRRSRVEVLDDVDGMELFMVLAGRSVADPDAAEAIIELSGGLPLAIRIAAGRLACRPDMPVGHYARRLADSSRRLDELQLDDLAVRASIRTSYDALRSSDDSAQRRAARAFRMLGLLQVPDVTPAAVAAMLAEADVAAAQTALDRLVDAQLLQPVWGDRYQLHDLVRLVAAERAADEDSARDRAKAVGQGIAFYTGALWSAGDQINLGRTQPFGVPPVDPDVPPPSFGSPREARMWIDDELRSLVAVLEQAVALDGAVGRLSLWLGYELWTSLDARCEWHTGHRVSRLQAEIAARAADRELHASSLLLRGRSEACLGNYLAAADCLGQALDVARELDNHRGTALALNALGIVEVRRHRPAAALSRLAEALDVARRHRLTDLEGSVLNNISVSHAALGQLDHATAAVERSSMMKFASNRTTRAPALINLASVYCLGGRQVDAARCADESLALSRESGDRSRECEVLIVRSEVNRRRGRLAEAVSDVEASLTLAHDRSHRFVTAAAHHQRARVLADMGRDAEAAEADATARDLYANLTGASRDVMIELLLAGDSSQRRNAWACPAGVTS